ATITVGRQGNFTFGSIQAAIDSIKTNNDRWIKIHIEAGLYIGKIYIPQEKPCIILEGEGSRKTIITFWDHIGIDTSATFTSEPPNVVATDIGFMNCSINAVGINSTGPGFVTAQGRESPTDPSGFVFEGGSLVGDGKVNLGRAWRAYSRVIFHGTYLSSVVTPEGWNPWNYTGSESNFTYAEVDCKGPGADTSKRVKWIKTLNQSQLNEFSLTSFINKDGWIDNLPIIF
ncbi:Putative pectinesterase 52, partial [Glycine soja]